MGGSSFSSLHFCNLPITRRRVGRARAPRRHGCARRIACLCGTARPWPQGATFVAHPHEECDWVAGFVSGCTWRISCREKAGMNWSRGVPLTLSLQCVRGHVLESQQKGAVYCTEPRRALFQRRSISKYSVVSGSPRNRPNRRDNAQERVP